MIKVNYQVLNTGTAPQIYLYGTVNTNNMYITKFTNFKNYIFFKGFTVIVSIYYL
jgi:hypothetical protein